MQERTFVKSMKPYWLYGGAGFVVFAGITFLLNRLGLKPGYGGIGGYIGFYIVFG